MYVKMLNTILSFMHFIKILLKSTSHNTTFTYKNTMHDDNMI